MSTRDRTSGQKHKEKTSKETEPKDELKLDFEAVERLLAKQEPRKLAEGDLDFEAVQRLLATW